MSLRDYEISQDIDARYDVGEDFYGVVMALLKRADTVNQAKIRAAWPETCRELEERYELPAGLRVGEKSLDGTMERREDGIYENDQLVRPL